MRCAHCNLEIVEAQPVFCPGCGQRVGVPSQPVTVLDRPARNVAPPVAPVKLEVSLGAVVNDAPAHLKLRITSHVADDLTVTIALSCGSLAIDSGLTQELILPAGHAVDLDPHCFTARSGSHSIRCQVTVDRQPWIGEYHVNVQTLAPQINLHGPQVHHAGGYQIGDSPVSMNVTLGNLVEPNGESYREVPLRLPQVQQRLRKQRWTRSELDSDEPRRQLTLTWHRVGQPDLVWRLHAGQQFVLGRHRECDVHLKPHWEEGDQQNQYQQISRRHARLEFSERGMVLIDLSSNGTQVQTAHALTTLAQGQRMELRHGSAIDFSGLRLTAEWMPPEQWSANETAAYRRWVEEELDASWTPPTGKLPAVRFERSDALQATQVNLLFQQMLLLGRDPSCAIGIDDASLAPRHARLWHLGERFWFEPLQMTPRYYSRVGDETISLHHLVPVRPGMLLQLGELEFSFGEYQ